jgi:excisionase family DNA binding protein
MTRSRSGQHRKVKEARAVVDQALGDASRRDAPQVVAKYTPMTRPTEPVQTRSEAIAVLTVKEAAVRLGISTSEIEALVARGAVKSVVAGWTPMLPTGELEKLADHTTMNPGRL